MRLQNKQNLVSFLVDCSSAELKAENDRGNTLRECSKQKEPAFRRKPVLFTSW